VLTCRTEDRSRSLEIPIARSAANGLVEARAAGSR
jgi:hypothetical protein